MQMPTYETTQMLPAGCTVAVIGAGTMGRGIALVAASAGHQVFLYDIDASAINNGLLQLEKDLSRSVSKGKISESDKKDRLSRISPADCLEAVAGAGLIIEAVLENLEIKVSLFKKLEAIVDSSTILATNTSSLSITSIAAQLIRPQQFVGMHFFNPPMLMPLVEVVSGIETDTDVTKVVYGTAIAWGKAPVLCQSTPGFIVNRVARPFYGEALKLVQEQAAPFDLLDAIYRDAGSFRMGPFELMDLIGQDVNFAVTRTVYEEFFYDPRYRPSLIQKDLVDAGWLGRKSGRGFYQYQGADHLTDVPSVPEVIAPEKVIVEGNLGIAHPLVERARKAGVEVETRPGLGVIRVGEVIAALTDGLTATERTVKAKETVVLFDLVYDFSSAKHIAVTAGIQTDSHRIAPVIGFFQALGISVSVIEDVPGLVIMRTVAMIINEAADVVHQGVATVDDVDLAMQKGVNYPMGPLRWAEEIGLPHVYQVMQNLATIFGIDRYRPSPLLRMNACVNKGFY